MKTTTSVYQNDYFDKQPNGTDYFFKDTGLYLNLWDT